MARVGEPLPRVPRKGGRVQPCLAFISPWVPSTEIRFLSLLRPCGPLGFCPLDLSGPLCPGAAEAHSGSCKASGGGARLHASQICPSSVPTGPRKGPPYPRAGASHKPPNMSRVLPVRGLRDRASRSALQTLGLVLDTISSQGSQWEVPRTFG